MTEPEAIAALSKALGRKPAIWRESEVRWHGNTTRGKYIFYRNKGIVYDTSLGEAVPLRQFLAKRGIAAMDETQRAPRRAPPRFVPPATRAEASLSPISARVLRYIDKVGYPASWAIAPRLWHGAPCGSKHGAWPVGKDLPSGALWVPAAPKSQRMTPGLAGCLVVPLHSMRSWIAAEKDGLPAPVFSEAPSAHAIWLDGDGRQIHRFGRNKTTWGAKRGCLHRIGGTPRNGCIHVVEGYADALAVASAHPGDCVLTSAGMDIASPSSHGETIAWIAKAGSERITLHADGDDDGSGLRQWEKLAAAIRRAGGRDPEIPCIPGFDPCDTWSEPSTKPRAPRRVRKSSRGR